MLPVERRKQIVSWLEKENTLRIPEISKRLQVSEMTIYRDVHHLVENKKVLKTSSGITLYPKSKPTTKLCTYCFKHSTTRLAVRLIKLNDEVEHTCCAHCGLLRYKDIENEVTQIICTDFLKDTTISAKLATFLINSKLELHCCQPEVLVFDCYDHALKFQQGFGGTTYSFTDAIYTIQKEMKGDQTN